MKLKRVEINGFKSFGRKTVIDFPEGLSAIVGPNGSGKCVTGDTKVLLADGSSQRIDELVDSRLDKAAIIDDGWMAAGDGTEVLSLGDDLKVHKRPVKAFVKRTAPKELVRIRTRTGREITTTPYHPLFTLQEGKVRPARADTLAEGVRIAIPREVDLPDPDKTFVELLDLITAEDGLYVPHSKDLVELVREGKGKHTWASLAKEANIPASAIKGLLDGQAMNFSHCVKLLRTLGTADKRIIGMVPAVKAKNHTRLCKIPWGNTPELSRMLGYLLAEGRYSQSNQIWFTNGTEEVVQDYHHCITTVFGIRATINEYKANAYDVLAYSKPAQVILEKLGMKIGGKAGDKGVAELFFRHAGDNEIAELLNGLYCGDGHVGKSCIEMIIKSPHLADAVECALLRLGIVSRRKKVIKTATNSGFSGVYEKVAFYDGVGFRRFADRITLVHEEKERRVGRLLERTPNPNVDLMEVNDIVKQAVNGEGISVKKSKTQFPRLDSYCYDCCVPSRKGVQELVQNAFGQSQSDLVLQSLCTSHVFWDEISSIETIGPEDPWVYDLCVEEDHNFIANNIFVHNSNVIDAICFALGYPSRNLRAAKAQELIHSGDSLSLPQAKVGLVFQRGDECFEVKRKVDRKGRSVYKLNSIATTLDDLHDTLLKHSIPKDGYNIVMQNDVMKFIEIRPKERRQLLDQISGISGYEDKKKKSLEELAVVERRISDTNLILSEKKGYLEEVGKDREVAMKYQGMQEELKTGKSVYLYSMLGELEGERDGIGKRMDELAKEKDIKIIELARIDEEIEGIEESLEGITKRIIETSGGETGRIKGEIGGLKSGIEKKQEEIQFLKGEIEGLEEKKKSNAGRQRELASQAKGKEEELKKLKDEVAKVTKSLAEKERERETKAKDYDDSELLMLEQERKSLSESIFESKKSLTLLDKELDILRKRESELEESAGKWKAMLRTLEAELEEREKDISKLGAEAERIEKAAAELEETKSRLSELFQEFARMESEIKTIERIEAKRGESESLKFVKENRSRGYLGRVSELGSAPEKHKKALEAAAGDKSKCLVVKDDKAAQSFIEGLRKNKIGRATFLPLNKVRGPELGPAEGAGVLGYAKDLIKCDKKYQRVFDFIFGDTLVVKDLKAARGVGIGKRRMVTLDGDLVAKGGAMTGGYYQKAAVTFSSTEEKKKRLEELKRDIAGLKDRKGELERGLADKERINIDLLREKKSNVGEKIDSLRNDLVEAQKELEGIAAQKSELSSKKADSEKSISKQEKELEALEKKMNMDAFKEMKEILQSIDNDIHDLKDHRFELQSRENSLRNEMDGMRARIKDIDRQTDEIGKSVSKFKAKIQESIGHITESGQRLKELEEKHSLATEESQKSFKEQERLNQLLKELGEKKGALEAEVEKLKKESNELEVRGAKNETKLEEVKEGMEGVEPPSKEDMEDVDLQKLGKRIKELEKELGAIEGVNLRAVDMFEELENQYAEIKEKNERLYVEKEKIYDLIENIEEKKKTVFFDSFYKVKEHFGQIISELYPGTDGNLALENDANPFDSGLMLEVKPRGRAGMSIDALSGGEKTLTALAFLMATQSVTPSPFYILDEIDAALDQENVLRLVQFLKNRKQSQFILISHNPETVKHMDSVVGVHMQKGVSRIVGVDMQTAET